MTDRTLDLVALLSLQTRIPSGIDIKGLIKGIIAIQGSEIATTTCVSLHPSPPIAWLYSELGQSLGSGETELKTVGSTRADMLDNPTGCGKNLIFFDCEADLDQDFTSVRPKTFMVSTQLSFIEWARKRHRIDSLSYGNAGITPTPLHRERHTVT